MGLGYQYKKARKTLRCLAPEDRCALEKICHAIQQAEEDLRKAAADALRNCQSTCRGICCRNVDLDAVLGFADFVYILTLAPDLADKTAACLGNEPVLYISDCIFLENGTGPCIFPETVMPEVCITTFCGDDTPARKEIKRLKWKFFHLNWFLGTLKFRIFLRHLAGMAGKRQLQ